MDAVLLVPVKAFAVAKARLKPVLDSQQRNQLARWTAARVLAAGREMPTYVACDDEEVAEWATSHGANVLWHPDEGLNPAVNSSIDALRARRVGHVVVAHGDLPRPDSLASIVRSGVLTLIPDRHSDGTNVAVIPTGVDFQLSYGPGSFRRHLCAAMEARLPVEVRRDPMLGLDIDTAADLRHPAVLEVLPSWLRTNLDNHVGPDLRG